MLFKSTICWFEPLNGLFKYYAYSRGWEKSSKRDHQGWYFNEFLFNILKFLKIAQILFLEQSHVYEIFVLHFVCSDITCKIIDKQHMKLASFGYFSKQAKNYQCKKYSKLNSIIAVIPSAPERRCFLYFSTTERCRFPHSVCLM